MTENFLENTDFYDKKSKKAIEIDRIIFNYFDLDCKQTLPCAEIAQKVNDAGILASIATIERRVRMILLIKRFFLSSKDERDSIKKQYLGTKDKRIIWLGIESLLQEGFTSWEQIKSESVSTSSKNPPAKKQAKKTGSEDLSRISEGILRGMKEYFAKIQILHKNSEKKSTERLDESISLNAEINGMAILLKEKENEISAIKKERDLLLAKYKEAEKEKRILQEVLNKNFKAPRERNRKIAPILNA